MKMLSVKALIVAFVVFLLSGCFGTVKPVNTDKGVKKYAIADAESVYQESFRYFFSVKSDFTTEEQRLVFKGLGEMQAAVVQLKRITVSKDAVSESVSYARFANAYAKAKAGYLLARGVVGDRYSDNKEYMRIIKKIDKRVARIDKVVSNSSVGSDNYHLAVNVVVAASDLINLIKDIKSL